MGVGKNVAGLFVLARDRAFWRRVEVREQMTSRLQPRLEGFCVHGEETWFNTPALFTKANNIEPVSPIQATLPSFKMSDWQAKQEEEREEEEEETDDSVRCLLILQGV